jgi:hypothetical protein
MRSAGGAYDIVHGTLAQQCARDFLECAKTPMTQGFS